MLELNPALDRVALAHEFATKSRLQIRDVLAPAGADAVRKILADATPWGLAWQAGATAPPQLIRAEQLRSMSKDEITSILRRAAADPVYGFAYHSYPLVTAYLERWNPGSAHDRLLEELNSPEVLQLVRDVTGIAEIVKMDGQATLYAPGHFLPPHNDEESLRGRRVAYVLNLTLGKWRPQWGGYLNFFTGDWDIDQAFCPRFNSLNLFRVPQWHSVGEVSAAAPIGRYAVTGWARDR